MPAQDVRLDASDAAELAELLGFVNDWLNCNDSMQLAASFRRFVGTAGYETNDLRTDLVVVLDYRRA